LGVDINPCANDDEKTDDSCGFDFHGSPQAKNLAQLLLFLDGADGLYFGVNRRALVCRDEGQYCETRISRRILAQDLINKRYRYKDRVDEVEREKNRTKSHIRSRVEHVFALIKRKFGYVKVRYRKIRKNANQLFTLCALSNLFVLCRRLLVTHGA
jgi:hypothetical protein